MIAVSERRSALLASVAFAGLLQLATCTSLSVSYDVFRSTDDQEPLVEIVDKNKNISSPTDACITDPRNHMVKFQSISPSNDNSTYIRRILSDYEYECVQNSSSTAMNVSNIFKCAEITAAGGYNTFTYVDGECTSYMGWFEPVGNDCTCNDDANLVYMVAEENTPYVLDPHSLDGEITCSSTSLNVTVSFETQCSSPGLLSYVLNSNDSANELVSDTMKTFEDIQNCEDHSVEVTLYNKIGEMIETKTLKCFTSPPGDPSITVTVVPIRNALNVSWTKDNFCPYCGSFWVRVNGTLMDNSATTYSLVENLEYSTFYEVTVETNGPPTPEAAATLSATGSGTTEASIVSP